jgi:hypothetical protein
MWERFKAAHVVLADALRDFVDSKRIRRKVREAPVFVNALGSS